MAIQANSVNLPATLPTPPAPKAAEVEAKAPVEAIEAKTTEKAAPNFGDNRVIPEVQLSDKEAKFADQTWTNLGAQKA